MTDQQPQLPTGFQRHVLRYPFYVRIGFGCIILFGLVGNCAGKTDGALAVFVLTTMLWVCCRIIQEAIDSLRLLKMLNEYEDQLKKQPPADKQ
jgi:hypothetical protein